MRLTTTPHASELRRLEAHPRGATVSTVVGLHSIPPAIRSLDTLPRPDYADMFTLTAAGATDKSAEEWARALLEETPFARRYAFFPWRILLHLRLGPRSSPQHVYGWRIADRGDHWIRIEAASWFMTAHGVIHVQEGRLSVAWFGRYDRPVAALVWPPLSPFHRRANRLILRQAITAHDAIHTAW